MLSHVLTWPCRYIKELSERVQQVESQMAMSGPTGPTGYRSSLDAASPSGGYTDVFSPDDPIPLSLKRTISLPDGKNPFAQPQFMNRDRIPSTGGWSINSGSRAGGKCSTTWQQTTPPSDASGSAFR